MKHVTTLTCCFRRTSKSSWCKASTPCQRSKRPLKTGWTRTPLAICRFISTASKARARCGICWSRYKTFRKKLSLKCACKVSASARKKNSPCCSKLLKLTQLPCAVLLSALKPHCWRSTTCCAAHRQCRLKTRCSKRWTVRFGVFMPSRATHHRLAWMYWPAWRTSLKVNCKNSKMVDKRPATLCCHCPCRWRIYSPR